MTRMLFGPSAILATIQLLPAVAPGQHVHPEWQATFNGPTNGLDHPVANAVDRFGNVYVAGYSEGISLHWILTVASYDAQGNQRWIRQFGGNPGRSSFPQDIVVDDAGNVYVVGYAYYEKTLTDYLTIKYDAAGNELWARRYSGLNSPDDKAFALAVDILGNVYVTGYVTEGIYNCTTVAYAPDGEQKWVHALGGGGGGSGITVDNRGHVYVAGVTAQDYVTIKYEADTGSVVWVRSYNGPGDDFDLAENVVVDSEQNVYVTGYSEGAGTSYDFATIKYDRDGNQQWLRRYDGPGHGLDWFNEIALDGSGCVIVTGESYGGTATNVDLATIKYDPNGNELWVRRYDGPYSQRDDNASMAVGPDGSVYVNGETRDSASGGPWVMPTLKYEPDGTQVWVYRYETPGASSTTGRDVALGPEGHIYVLGSTVFEQSSVDFLTVKYVEYWPGDLNCDGVFNGADIDPFFLALGDPAAYAARFPNCNILNGDMNGDDALNGADIDPFFACLGGNCP